jgi:hypothetical protein
MCYLSQVLPTAERDRFEGYWENIHQPGGTANPGGLQDPQDLDIDHYVLAGYHPMLGE